LPTLFRTNLKGPHSLNCKNRFSIEGQKGGLGFDVVPASKKSETQRTLRAYSHLPIRPMPPPDL
jgi:hypothetical protein